jgi:hypothetical protein
MASPFLVILVYYHGASIEKVEEIRKKKAEARSVFKEKLFLNKVEVELGKHFYLKNPQCLYPVLGIHLYAVNLHFR